MAEALTIVRGQVCAVGDLAGGVATLWEQIEQSDELPLCRSLTINLIGVADAAHESTLRNALDRLLFRHPCRAFLVIVDDEIADLRAEIGARIRKQKRSRQTCLEEVALRCDPSDFAKVPGVIRPLVVNDIPVHLFWAAPVPDNTWGLATMARLADQTVIDSSLFSDPTADLGRLADLAGVEATDLSSFRSRPWRRALAEAFEHFEWSADTPTGVVLTHGDRPGAIASSYLVRDWLRERLGAAVDLETDETGDAPEFEPKSMSLHHGDIHVGIEHVLKTPRLRTMVTLGDRCMLPFETPATRGEVGDLLAAAMDTI